MVILPVKMKVNASLAGEPFVMVILIPSPCLMVLSRLGTLIRNRRLSPETDSKKRSCIHAFFLSSLSCRVVEGAITSFAVVGVARAPKAESFQTRTATTKGSFTVSAAEISKSTFTPIILAPGSHSAILVLSETRVWSGSSSIVAGVPSRTSLTVVLAARSCFGKSIL